MERLARQVGRLEQENIRTKVELAVIKTKAAMVSVVAAAVVSAAVKLLFDKI